VKHSSLLLIVCVAAATAPLAGEVLSSGDSRIDIGMRQRIAILKSPEYRAAADAARAAQERLEEELAKVPEIQAVDQQIAARQREILLLRRERERLVAREAPRLSAENAAVKDAHDRQAAFLVTATKPLNGSDAAPVAENE
jgi:hypothetical protein